MQTRQQQNINTISTNAADPNAIPIIAPTGRFSAPDVAVVESPSVTGWVLCAAVITVSLVVLGMSKIGRKTKMETITGNLLVRIFARYYCKTFSSFNYALY